MLPLILAVIAASLMAAGVAILVLWLLPERDLPAQTSIFAGAGGEREIVIHGGPGGHAMGGPHGEGGPGERIEIRRMGGPGGEQDLDVDDDGRISEAEFSAPLREAFARMDADRSGFIEAGERGPGHGAGVFVHRIETRQNGED